MIVTSGASSPSFEDVGGGGGREKYLKLCRLCISSYLRRPRSIDMGLHGADTNRLHNDDNHGPHEADSSEQLDDRRHLGFYQMCRIE